MMCLSTKAPDPPKPPPMPNRQDEANQSAVQQTLRRRQNNGPSGTNLTGGLGDANFGQNVNRATLTGQTN